MTPERRTHVLEAATQVFAQHGYKKASIADIARAAGVSKGAIYLVAPSKEALYFEILHHRFSACAAEVLQAIRVDIPADQQLPEALAMELRHLYTEPLIRALLLHQPQNTSPEARARFSELRRLGRSTTTRLIELGMRQGCFRTDIDADQVAELLQDLQVASFLLHPAEDGQLDTPRWRAVIQVFLDGLRTR